MSTGYESAVVAGIGGFVGMAAALGYGFKSLVDVVGGQLKVQNQVIHNMESDIAKKLDDHIEDCRDCQRRSLLGGDSRWQGRSAKGEAGANG